MVDSILAKLELSPDTPAVDYVKAAVALQQKNEAEAKDWISAAEKNYSPQLNKLFVESLYEVGWLEKPSGQGRASLPLMTAAERSEKTKAFARSKFEQSQQAFRQRDFATALKLIDEADKADPNQPATLEFARRNSDAAGTIRRKPKLHLRRQPNWTRNSAMRNTISRKFRLRKKTTQRRKTVSRRCINESRAAIKIRRPSSSNSKST